MKKYMKEIVKKSYEENNYMKQYRQRELLPFEKMVFDKIIKDLPTNAKILDLGCGNGYPYDHYFSTKGFNLLGIDFCEKNIKDAQLFNPSGNYQCCEIEDFIFNQKYNFIMALFSVIHLPRETHKGIFQNVYNSLENGGMFLLTLRDEDSGETKHKDDFCGKEMYWSYYSYEYYKKFLEDMGFKIIFSQNQNQFGFAESHNWVILKK